MSPTCRWPFWVSQSRAGARYKSWQSMWLKLFLLDISGTPAHRFLAFQSRHHEKMSPFYLLGGIHQLNMTLRPGHDSSSLPLPRPFTSQHTDTRVTCPPSVSDILNNADAWPCWGNLSSSGNLELVSVAFWTNCTDLWNPRLDLCVLEGHSLPVSSPGYSIQSKLSQDRKNCILLLQVWNWLTSHDELFHVITVNIFGSIVLLSKAIAPYKS